MFAGLFFMCACTGPASDNPFQQELEKPPYKELTEQIRQEPKNDSLYFERGILLMNTNQPVAAQLDLEKAWSIKPKPDYALALAEQMMDAPKDQLTFLLKALKKCPNNFPLEWALAVAYKETNQVDSASAITSRWISKGINEPEFLLLHASLLKLQNKSTAALSILEKLHASNPLLRNVTEMLALWYAESGNEKVIPLCKNLETIDSVGKDPLPHYYRGIYYEKKKQYDQALKEFDQAIQKDYTDPDPYIEKAALLHTRGNYQLAMETLAKALAIAPDHPSVYYWTAKCQEAKGEREAARMNYLKAYGLDDRFTEAKQAADALK
jgi:tetratricopeptide (TPR) repeat protein